MRKLLLGVVLAAGSVFIACGDVDVPDHPDPAGHRTDNTPTDASDELSLRADNVTFVPAELTVRTGVTTTLTLENLDDVEHDFQIDEIDIEVGGGEIEPEEHNGGHADADLSVHAEPEESDSVTFVANERGTYEFYCTVAGHKDSGMVGTLTVE